MTTDANSWLRDDGVWIGAVMILAAAVFAVTVGYGFVYDDLRIIVERPDLQALSRWREILIAPWWNEELYRPLTRLSFAFDWTVSNGSASFFHVVNVVAHAAVTAGVYVIARAWVRRPGAAIAAGLFAVHPVHVEAVANIVGRAEILATGCTLLAVLAYRWDGRLASCGETSWRRAAASVGTLGALAAGLASKETAFAIPGILLLVDWLEGRTHDTPFAVRVKSHFPLWLASITIAIGWLVLRAELLGNVAGDTPGPGLYGQGFGSRVLIMAPILVEYVRLLVFPLRLSADYSPGFLSAQPVVTLKGLLGVVLLIGCCWVALAARQRAPLVAAGLAWVGGTILIISNLIVPSGVLLAERSLYLPSVGFVLVVGWLAQLTWMRYRRSVAMAVVGVVLGLGIVRTATRVGVWKDQDTFFPALVRDAPGSFRGQWVAAMLLYVDGDRVRGEQMLRAALNTYPLFPNVWRDYGNRLQEDGRWSDAASAFAAMYRIDSTRTRAAALAASNYLRSGNVEPARPLVESLRGTAPHDAYVQSVIGDFAMAVDQPLEAMTWFRRAAWQSAADPRLHSRAAEAAARAGFCPQFDRSLERLREIDAHHARLPELRRLGAQAGCEVREPGG